MIPRNAANLKVDLKGSLLSVSFSKFYESSDGKPQESV